MLEICMIRMSIYNFLMWCNDKHWCKTFPLLFANVIAWCWIYITKRKSLSQSGVKDTSHIPLGFRKINHHTLLYIWFRNVVWLIIFFDINILDGQLDIFMGFVYPEAQPYIYLVWDHTALPKAHDVPYSFPLLQFTHKDTKLIKLWHSPP